MSDSKDLITLEKNLLEKEEKIEKEREALEKEKEQFSKVKDEYREELSKVSSLTVEEARKQLLEEVEEREAQAVARIIREVEKIMFEEGEKLAHEVGIFNLSKDLISMLGRFKFRTSYGQNLVVHTLEETKIGIHIAQEVGANVNIVRLGCLF